MTSAFCPGHITCFFKPVYSENPLINGSVGAGMKLSLGSYVTVEERSDNNTNITVDGISSEANVTRSVVKMLAPGRGFDVIVENELPVSQGFGMSAAGSIAAGSCICHILGIEEYEAYKAAHISEAKEGGGLGDVSGIMGDGFLSFRTSSGIPPAGTVKGMGKKISLTLAVVGDKLETKNILSNSGAMRKISESGEDAIRKFSNSVQNDIFRISREFSLKSELESKKVSDALGKTGKKAAMCMLGNSIFTTYCKDHVLDALGSDTEVYECTSYDGLARIIRKE